MNWGKWIILSFVLFALFIGTLAVVCIREDISLVSKDYYQEELAYQEQIERLRNAEALVAKPDFRLRDHKVVVRFNQTMPVDSGRLYLFRPSDQRQDRNFTLAANNPDAQEFDVSTLPRGMYKARLLWSMAGKEYYWEEIINL